MTPTRVAVSSLIALFAASCGGPNVIIGERADGLTVECEEKEGDDVYVCEPDDGDEVCEPWDDGGAIMVMWPPNHKMVSFDAYDCVAMLDECAEPEQPADPSQPADAPVWSIDRVTADEPIDVGRGGDGHTDDFDVFLGDALSVDLRSERQGGGDGRVYRIHLVSDLGGEFSCEVHVPHDQGPFGGAIDSGEAVSVSN